MKQAMLTLVVLAVVAVTSVACNAGRPPTNASPEEFCAEVHAFYDGIEGLGGGASDREVAGMVKRLGERLARVGTPGSIPSDARDGFELTLDEIDGLPDDADRADLEALDADLGTDERRDAQAFDFYLAGTCGTSTSASGGPV